MDNDVNGPKNKSGSDKNTSTTITITENENPQAAPVIETTTLPAVATHQTSAAAVKVKVDKNMKDKREGDVVKQKKTPDKDPDDVDPSKKPSRLRQMVPIGLFLLTFATVLAFLFACLDTSGKAQSFDTF